MQMSSPPDDINFVHTLLDTVWQSSPHIDEAEQMRFELAIVELVSNVIKHSDSGAGVSCTLSIETFPDRIEAVLRDTGEPGNMKLTNRIMPDDDSESGRGIPIIHALVNEFSYERDGEFNIWRLTRNIDVAAEEDATSQVEEGGVQQSLLGSIIESTNDAVMSTNLNGTIEIWNPAAELMYGYSASEIIGKSFFHLVASENAEATSEIIGKILNNRKVEPYETVQVKKDGNRTAPLLITISAIHDKNGAVIGASAIARDITEQKAASQSALRMASIIESSNDAITSANLDCICTGWNAAAERMYGYTADEMIGQTFSELSAPGNIEELANNRRRIKDGYRIEPYETVRIRKDGSFIPISLTVSPIYDENGIIIGSSGSARDITEQKMASQNASNMASIIESSNDSIISRSLEGIITSWNPAAERMYGYSAEEMIGQPILRLLPPEITNENAEILNKIKSGLQVEPYETLRVRKDGSTILISATVSPIYDVNGTVIGSSGIARDITQEKAASQYARNMATIVESSNDAIYSTDIRGIVLSWNPGAERIYGFLAEEVLGQSISSIFPRHSMEEIEENQRTILNGNHIEPYETIRIRKDGLAVPISLAISPIYAENGEITGLSAIARDITQEKQASQYARNMASLVKTSNDAIVSASVEGTIFSWNPAAERMFGYLREEAIGQSISLIFPVENTQEFADIQRKIQNGSGFEPYETFRIKKDGNPIPISLTLSLIHDENGVVIGSSGISRDITEEKQIARNLIEINRANLKLDEISKVKIAEDLDRATKVQRGLLPKAFVNLPGFEAAGGCLPTQAVGGDFYDWYPVVGGAIFTLADVMGKGVGAAIIAATVRAVLRADSKHLQISGALKETAEILKDDLEVAGTFVTLFHARLDTDTGLLTYIDAGHGLTIIVRADGQTDRLASTNFPLGLSLAEPWDEQAATLELGDTLVSVSDGVLDLYDETIESLDAVAKIVRTSVSAQQIVDTLITTAKSKTAPDDVTVLVVRRSN